MNCKETRAQLPLLLYGELSFDEEEAVEAHLDACAECQVALERERELSAAFDGAAVEPGVDLLQASRQKLFAAVATESTRPRSVWERFLSAISIEVPGHWMPNPAAAVALLALGFLGARYVPQGMGGMEQASLVNLGAGRVRSVQPAGDGTVRIVFDETQQRTVAGRMDDPNIRELMFVAAKDPSDGLRAEAVTLWAQAPHNGDDVRNALVWSVKNDHNTGVRLKALDGLKAFVGEPEVRGALADVLATDTNPAMRSKAVDLLVQSLNGNEAARGVDPRMVGVLQEMMAREGENPYLREQCERALEMLKATAQVF